eukprot:TRINITY_DN4404_c0_g1_i1.p1 TRINITY_DN4404_c0_g1~~TRINITY_DN4404_c0_g1_i1.p1  ORF type:complete len:635 (+),score=85.21 TRINITY_DN4404_c0_g1_i1:98-2002(+)
MSVGDGRKGDGAPAAARSRSTSPKMVHSSRSTSPKMVHVRVREDEACRRREARRCRRALGRVEAALQEAKAALDAVLTGGDAALAQLAAREAALRNETARVDAKLQGAGGDVRPARRPQDAGVAFWTTAPAPPADTAAWHLRLRLGELVREQRAVAASLAARREELQREALADPAAAERASALTQRIAELEAEHAAALKVQDPSYARYRQAFQEMIVRRRAHLQQLVPKRPRRYSPPAPARPARQAAPHGAAPPETSSGAPTFTIEYDMLPSCAEGIGGVVFSATPGSLRVDVAGAQGGVVASFEVESVELRAPAAHGARHPPHHFTAAYYTAVFGAASPEAPASPKPLRAPGLEVARAYRSLRLRTDRASSAHAITTTQLLACSSQHSDVTHTEPRRVGGVRRTVPLGEVLEGGFRPGSAGAPPFPAGWPAPLLLVSRAVWVPLPGGEEARRVLRRLREAVRVAGVAHNLSEAGTMRQASGTRGTAASTQKRLNSTGTPQSACALSPVPPPVLPAAEGTHGDAVVPSAVSAVFSRLAEVRGQLATVQQRRRGDGLQDDAPPPRRPRPATARPDPTTHPFCARVAGSAATATVDVLSHAVHHVSGVELAAAVAGRTAPLPLQYVLRPQGQANRL